MDQTTVNYAIALCGALGGWVLKVIWEAILELKKDVKQMDAKMHDDFVRREDFKDAIASIKVDVKDGFAKMDSTLNLLFEKLDKKEDRSNG